MKTILYNPIFINPQAYYVFPRLTRYLQPDNESTAEPANYIGTIEVKVIAYGDTTLKRTYTNTDSIDLSEFKNTWIRISLFTKVGSCVLGEWKIGNMESDLPYIDPEVLASLKAVVIVGNKTNNDSDRAIVKNLVDADNPFVISNAAFKLNSGFGKYEQDFTDWKKSLKVTSFDSESIKFTSDVTWVLLYHPSSIGEDIPSFKVRIKLYGEGTLYYNYITQEGKYTSVAVKSEIFETPICYNTKYIGEKGVNVGFTLGVTSGECSGTITQIPSFEGAFVTDGVDDLITSTKTVQEMLGGSNEITVVSMIHKLSLDNNWTNLIGELKEDHTFVANRGINTDKTGIYGYTYNYKENAIVINNILGDKNDYIVRTSTSLGLDNKYYVTGFKSAGIIQNVSQLAWYWTFIANRVLTTDEINQVIAYYNLDRTLKPDILCNTIKQGITNENHAEFGDKLIDFSGNGRDIQLNNIAWDGDSGIGKYNYPNWKVTATIANTYSTIVNYPTVNGTYSINVNGVSELMQSIGLHLEIKYTTSTGIIYKDIKQDGVYSYILPDGATDLTLRFGGIPGIVNEPCNITITQIPSHAGAICLDGVNDFGKVTGMPIYKDYTFIIDRQIISIGDTNGIVASKSEDPTDVNKQGAFLFEYLGNPNNVSAWSFYKDNGKVANTDFTRGISYQSKYSYNGIELLAGTAFDSDKLWLGTLRDKDSRFANVAIYSLMSFPYSMSEFLIERQLKKHKLGTLYPDMVEFRPIVKSNNKWDTIEIWQGDKSLYRPTINDDKTGIYLKKDSTIGIYVKPYVGQKVSEIVYNGVSYTDLKLNSNGFYYKTVPITKSPQKIGITIEQDENYVLFNPVITSNVEYHKLDFYLNNYQKRINIGDYIPKDAYLRANFYLKNNVDELTAFIFNGVNIGYRRSSVDDTAFNIGYIYNYDSPQEVNITIDEYIRYEDIVQPYPVLLRFKDENGNEVSWGGKFKVGSTITRIGSIADPESNLLNGLYSISGLSLNGKAVTSSTSIVEKQMVFKTTATYLLDNNEPKCILSPSRLRIPNSSYKLLGYIPDISGHGNHGKINNSAYAGMSGVNGYPVVFGANKTWANESNGYVTSITSNTIHITNVLNAGLALLYSYVKYNGNLQNIKEIPPFKIEIKGLEGRSKFIYKYLATSDATKETNLYLGNGTHELPKSFLPTEALINNAVVGFSISPIEEGVTNFLSDITIKVLPEYEGAYCLDGVDDFVTIPTTVGGKQVLMKVNWDSSNSALLYDQRGYNNEFAIYNGSVDSDGNPIPAYQGRNNGQTYIDGILNSNIKASELRAITHNITITNELSAGVNKFSPVIGSNRVHNAYFTNMALYDFMLFDNISTDDKIKQLNEYVGIEGNTEWRKTK